MAAAAVMGASLVPAASAHDSLSPRGASHQWLPARAWVMSHWVPFDQARLEGALGLRGGQLEAFLFNDHHTLAQLATRRGWRIDALAEHLVAPWHGHVGDAQLDRLRERTKRILTQGHLAQHIFFHAFHSVRSTHAAHELFGVSSRRLQRLRNHGHTPLEIGRANGVSGDRLADGILDLLRERHRTGIETKQAWPAQSDRLLARQEATIGCWLRSPAPWRDRGNPYGKARWQHGRHDRGYPATPRDRAANERRVERVRQRLEWTCWPRVRAWRWPAREAAAARPASLSAVRW